MTPHPSSGVLTSTSGAPLGIWLDPRLPALSTLTPLIKAHGGELTALPSDPSASILVLHPSSIEVFDEYCHPVWLKLAGRLRHQRLVRAGCVEEWRNKVIVSDRWVGLLDVGAALSETLGGCRKGGPPASVEDQRPKEIPIIEAPIRPPTPPLPPKEAELEPTPEPAPPPRPAPVPVPFHALGIANTKRLNTIRSNLFTGLRFYVPKGTKGRKNINARIRESGGKVVGKIDTATHALFTDPADAEPKNGTEPDQMELIKAAQARDVWLISSRWVEDSRRTRRIAREVEYAAGGWVPPRLGLPIDEPLSSRLTLDALEPVFVEAHRKRLEEGSSPSLIADELAMEHEGVYRVETWSRLYELWHNRMGIFSTPGQSLAPQNTPTQDLEKLLREAHLLTFVTSAVPVDVPRHLHETNPQYSKEIWTAMYNNWLRFAEPFIPKPRDFEFVKHKPLFPTYMPLARAGTSLTDIAKQIAEDHPELVVSVEDFHVYFGTWLRKGGPEVPASGQAGVVAAGRKTAPIEPPAARAASKVPTQAQPVPRPSNPAPAAPAPAAARSTATPQPPPSAPTAPAVPAPKAPQPPAARPTRNELAKMFKSTFDAATFQPADVAAKMPTDIGFSATSLASYYKEWREGQGVFAKIKADLRYSGTGAAGPGMKRGAEDGEGANKRAKVA